MSAPNQLGPPRADEVERTAKLPHWVGYRPAPPIPILLLVLLAAFTYFMTNRGCW